MLCNRKFTMNSFLYFSHIHFHFYIVIMYLIFTCISSGNETDHQALLKIKSKITEDPYGALTSWNDSLHFCHWTGVHCGKRHKRVTRVALMSQGLKGSLSPYVGNLSFLRVLFIGNNSFQGAIPDEIGRLFRLRKLYLHRNEFNGAIPVNISSCINLEEVGLAGNKLVGSIPKEMSFLSKLIFVSLHRNNLTGGIPPFLGNITSMEYFSFSENPLGGSIPNIFGYWKLLKGFYANNCNLYGTIPSSFYNLSLLSEISMCHNHITGSLPRSIGTMLPHLVVAYLWDNQLVGSIPPSISNCSGLRDFEINNNSFSGKLTIDFAKLRYLSFLNLGYNNFGSNATDEMRFIDSLANCTRLKILYLSGCNFQGVLPKSIGNLSNQLHYLNLKENRLHGNLPKSIGNLVGMEQLYLYGNRFTGSIPSTMANLQKLRKLALNENQFSGQIPDAIGNLSMLIGLDLSSNKLEGRIPSSLKNCQHLLEIYLSDNKLNGNIPKQLLQLSSLSITLDLSHNNLFGPLPLEVGNLNMLSELDLSENNLSGSIPSSLSDCTSLSSLSLKGNSFQGMIPRSLVSLKALLELDLSHNKLSGQIPHFLERLQHLNLSYNDFEGAVSMSGVFANATTFSILGNSGLCGGVAELGLPKCNETKKNKKRLLFLILAILIPSTLFTLICLACVWFKKNKRQPPQSPTNDKYLKVSYNELFKATNGFSEANLLGRGKFSSVYKGTLGEDNEMLVAVKVLRLQNPGAQRSFMRECEAWRNIRHRNLLKIITSCSSIDFQGNDFKALVYEFMPNGSLHDWLHSSERNTSLNFLKMVNIVMDIASVLDYLHNHCIPAIVHGDLKPTNILLDDDMAAHIGDFGLTRYLGTSYSNTSTGIRGTIGYVAPEYGMGSQMTCSGDVYSFGVLLLEVMTRKKPTDDIFNEGFNLHNFASMSLPDHVTDVIDFDILEVYDDEEIDMQNKDANAKKIEECVAAVVEIGVSCSMDSPLQRMDMKNVVNKLQHILDKLKNM